MPITRPAHSPRHRHNPVIVLAFLTLAAVAPGQEDGAAPAVQITAEEPLVLRLTDNRLTTSGVLLRSGPYQLQAGEVQIDREAGTATLTGGVFLDREDASTIDLLNDAIGVIENLSRRLREERLAISAETAAIRREGEAGSVFFTGEPTIRIPEGKLLASSVYLQEEPRLLRAEHLRMGNGVVLISAESVEVTDDHTRLRGVRFFLLEPARFGLFMEAAEANSSGDGRIRLRRVKAGVGPLPLLYLPRWSIADGPAVVVFGGRIGTRARFGLFAEAGLQARTRLAGGELTLEPGLSLYTERGVLPRPVARWKTETERGQRLNIDFDASFIRDEGGPSRRGTDSRGRPVPSNRYHSLVRSHGYDPTAGYFLFQGDWRSDSEFFRDYHRSRHRSHYDPDSFLETGTPLGPLVFSTVTRFRARDYQAVTEALPSLALDLPTSSFGPRQPYWTGSLRYARLRRLGSFGQALAEANRSELLLQAEQATPLSTWLTATPVVAGRVSHYDRARDGSGTVTRPLGQIGLDLEGDFHAISPYRNSILRMDGIQHVFRPALEYRWFPGVESEQDRIPLLEPLPYISGIQPLGLLDRREVESLDTRQVARIRLGNVFFTREDGAFSRRIARIDLAQDFVLDGTPGPFPQNSVATSATLSPIPWLDLEVFSRFDTDSLTLLEILPELRLADGDLWLLSIAYEGLQSQINELTTTLEYQLNYRTRLHTFLRYNGQSGQLTGQSYGFERMINREWAVRLTVSLIENDARRENFRLSTTLVSRLF